MDEPAARGVDDHDDGSVKGPTNASLMREIVQLKVDESLLFCPTAVLGVGENGSARKLHEGYVEFKTRQRLTTDGGRARVAN
jgi:hypothetical protein